MLPYIYIYKSVAVRSYNYNKIINIVYAATIDFGKLHLFLISKRKESVIYLRCSVACTRKSIYIYIPVDQ